MSFSASAVNGLDGLSLMTCDSAAAIASSTLCEDRYLRASLDSIARRW